MTYPRGKKKRAPVPPGEMIKEDFLPACGLTAVELAAYVGLSESETVQLLDGTKAVDKDVAAALARLFGNSEQFWLNAQRALDARVTQNGSCQVDSPRQS